LACTSTFLKVAKSSTYDNTVVSGGVVSLVCLCVSVAAKKL